MISIIIPVLNEAQYVKKVLDHIMANSYRGNTSEIIVVDGGSTDGSQKIISEFKKVVLMDAPMGRAKQLNAGAQAAQGDILYFLHADSFPPKDFDQMILKHVGENSTGCFRLRFENSSHFLLKVAKWFTQFNFSLFRGGDQSLFIKKENFMALGGFDERYFIFEDIELINRIREKFAFTIIPDYIITSERKFIKNGVLKLYFNFLMIHVKNYLGASPEALYAYYLKHIHE